MIKKIVLFGSESTGKTTLAEQLAKHYQTTWVPEYSRFYQEQKGSPCDLADVIPIAQEQIRLEEQALIKANRVLICDTDILVTKIYSEVYNGTYPVWLAQQLHKRLGDLYLLTSIDLPWISDGIRDSGHRRTEMQLLFEKELIDRKLPYVNIYGHGQDRFIRATEVIDAFLNTKS